MDRSAMTQPKVFTSAVAALALTLLLRGVAVAAEPPPTKPPTAATLTVLSGVVEHARVADRARVRATSGADLAEGDRVATGAEGRALITFLDGTTVTVEPGSDVMVRELPSGQREPSRVRLLILAGTLWARVAGWLGGRGTVTLESNAYSATARDGLIGAQARSDGGFVSWTRAGEVVLRDAGGERAVLRPGEKGTFGPDGAVTKDAFSVNASTIEIVVDGPVMPLLVMPDGVRAAGFVPPGIEVNQVFGSFTGVRDGRRVIQVPAGLAGPFRLVLVATGDGTYSVAVVGRAGDRAVYWGERRGRTRAGERRGGEIVQRFGEFERPDPRTARVVDGWLGAFGERLGGVPPTIVLSPLELSSTVQR
jgi:FecR protein